MKRYLIIALAGVSSAALGQELLTNPGFETGDMTGWTIVNAGNFSGVNQPASATPHSGTMWFGMGATTEGNQTDFFQDVATNIGEQYTASYWAYDIDAASAGGLAVTFDGQLIGPRPSVNGLPYLQYSLTITATAATTRLQAKGWEANQWIITDDYSVQSAVPEPASVLAIGLGLAALAARRRRS